jgi:ribosomal protein S18 acetylase RimI-like enzyme
MIRAYTPDDLDTVVDIANRAWRPIHEAYRKAMGDDVFQALIPNPETRVGELVKTDIEAHPGQTIVCVEDGKIVGFCDYFFEEDKTLGVIGYNATDPDCHLKGIGQQMYRWVLDEFRRRGMRFARVYTGLDDGHAPARRAYERAGFNIQRGNVTYYMKLGEDHAV